MEGGSEGTQMVALYGHYFLLFMVRGVCMDLDPGEMPSRGVQWMVRWLPARLSFGSDVDFVSGVTHTTLHRQEHAFWGLYLD